MINKCFGTNKDLGMFDINLVTPAGSMSLALNSPSRQLPSSRQYSTLAKKKSCKNADEEPKNHKSRVNKLLLQPDLYKKTASESKRIFVIGSK